MILYVTKMAGDAIKHHVDAASRSGFLGEYPIHTVLGDGSWPRQVRSLWRKRRIRCRGRPEGNRAHGALADPGRRILGHQLRGDEVRCRVPPPAAHRRIPVHRWRLAASVRPAATRAGERARTQGCTSHAGTGLPRRGDGPDCLHLRYQPHERLQHRSRLRHRTGVGAAPGPSPRAGEALPERHTRRHPLYLGDRHSLP